MRAAAVLTLLAATVLLGGCRDAPRAEAPPPAEHVLDDVESTLRGIEADVRREQDADGG